MSNYDKHPGNPKTLRIAIRLAILDTLKDADPNNDVALAIIKDYLAQKFAVAFMGAGCDGEKLDLVSSLWKEITREDNE